MIVNTDRFDTKKVQTICIAIKMDRLGCESHTFTKLIDYGMSESVVQKNKEYVHILQYELYPTRRPPIPHARLTQKRSTTQLTQISENLD